MHWIALALIGGLAVWQSVETIHHGVIFRCLREAARRNKELRGELSWGAAVLCPFCLSHWISALIVVLLGLSLLSPVFLLIPLWLAVTRVANVLNDVFHPYTRTPKEEIEIPVSEERTSSA